MARRDDNDDLPIAIQRLLQREKRISERPTQRELDLASRLASSHSALVKAQTAAAGKPADPILAESLENRRNEYEQAQTRLVAHAQQQETLTSARLRSAVYTATSPSAIRQDVAHMRSMQETRQEAYSLAYRRRDFDPQHAISRASRGLAAVHQRMEMIVEDPDMPRAEREYELAQLASRAQRFTQRRATAEIAGQILHRQGRDEEGVMRGAEAAINRHRKMIGQVEVSEEVAAGKHGSIKDIQLKLIQTGRDLAAAQEALAKETSNEAKVRRGLQKNIENLKAEYERNEQILEETKRQQGGDGRGAGTALRAMGAVGTGLMAVGASVSTYYDYQRFKGVGSELQLLDARIGYAQLANRQYRDTQAMSQGDMSAYMRIMGGAYGAAVQKGADLRVKEAEALTGGLFGAGIGYIGKITAGAGATALFGSAGLAAATGIGLPAAIGLTAASGALVAAASSSSDIGNIAKTKLSLEKQLPQAQVDIESQNKMLQLYSEMTAPRADQMQKARDQFMMMWESLRGTGTGTWSIPERSWNETEKGIGPLWKGSSAVAPVSLQKDIQQASIYGPGARGIVTEVFGKRVHPITGKPDTHSAIDVAAGGATLNAPFSGTLQWYTSKTGGLTASIRSDDGQYVVKAAHLSSMAANLKQGQTIKAGQAFGVEGTTGASTGIHTHWSLLEKTGALSYTPRDPRELFKEFADMQQKGGLGVAGASAEMDVTRGGGRYSDMLRTAMGMRGVLAGLGIRPEEQAQLWGGLRSAMGVNISQGGPEAALRAAQWSAQGMLTSPQQYTDLIGRMTGVGGGTRDLEEALKAAVLAGLDSSKNIEQMVSGISTLSAKSAMAGLSVAPGATEQLLSVTAALDKAGVDKNIQIAAAQNAISTIDAAGGGFGYDLQSIYGMQRATREGIKDPNRKILYSGMDATQWQAAISAAKSGQADKLQLIAKQGGFEDRISTMNQSEVLAFLQRGYRGRIAQDAVGVGAPLTAPAAFKAIDEASRSGKAPPQWAVDQLGIAGTIYGQGRVSRVGAEAVFAGATKEAGYGPMREKASQQRIQEIYGTTKGSVAGLPGAGLDIKGTEAGAEVGQAVEGERQMGDIRVYAKVLQGAIDKVDWGKMADQAANAASKLETPLGELGTTVGQLDTVLGKTVSRLENLVKSLDAKGFKGSNTPVSGSPVDDLNKSRNAAKVSE